MTIGLVTWVGYSPIYVADKQGFFADEKLDLRIQTMDQTGQREQAYLAGELDFFPNTPDAFVILFANQPSQGKYVAGLDESRGADGLIARSDINTIAGLRGKTVGFQSGITSHFLLLYLLKQAGLSGSDVKQENLSAGDAGAAFLAGKLDAAVTWEPFLSKARGTAGAKVLATSADTDRLIVDVVLVSNAALKKDPKAAEKFLRAWHRAVKYMEEHPDDAKRTIASALHTDDQELDMMLRTTRFLTATESRDYMTNRFSEVSQTASELFRENKVIEALTNLKPDVAPVMP